VPSRIARSSTSCCTPFSEMRSRQAPDPGSRCASRRVDTPYLHKFVGGGTDPDRAARAGPRHHRTDASRPGW
jgi:hypothetical protein